MMKKVLLSLLVVTVSCVATRAQSEAFRHYAVGVNVGTTGIGFDLGTTLGSHLQFRVGMNFMPKIKVKSQLDINTSVSGISLSDVWTDIPALPHNAKEKVAHPTQKLAQ